MPVETASIQDHEIISKICRMSSYTAGFTNIMFSGRENYEKGWIGKYVNRGRLLGFICLRHAVRKKKTIVYDVGVHIGFKGKGIGRQLLQWAMDTSPYKVISLNVDDRNTDAIRFYKKLGFKKDGSGMWGSKHSQRPYTTWTVKEKLNG